MQACWCGNTDLEEFGGGYARCRDCGTLVSQGGLPAEKLLVVDDEKDYYGRNYWFSHQTADLGFGDIRHRARTDPGERNLHWLNTLLRFRKPPGRLIELGCAHGGFVALARQAGFDATGLEMSPWVVEFAKETFDIPMIRGPIEQTDIASGSLDVIALMDVLEHLPDPKGTMACCRDLLKPDGILIIQTPQFREELEYRTLVDEGGAFLEQLKTDEHLFLFTTGSIQRLLGELGFNYFSFEPAIFYTYDMFLVSGRSPLLHFNPEEISDALCKTAQGRILQAFFDVNDRLLKEIEIINADREARLADVHTLTAMVHELQKKV